MKKITFCILGTLLFLNMNYAKAQLEFATGYSHWKFSSQSFDTFRESYNNFGSSYAQTQNLSEFSPSKSMFYEVGYGITGMDVRVSYAPVNSTSTAKFLNGEQRVFNLKGGIWQWELGARAVSENAYFGVYLGMVVPRFNTSIDSYYIYADGTKSYGGEKFINAVFLEKGASMTFSCRFGLGAKAFKLIGAVEYIGVLNKWANQNGGLDMKDNFNNMFVVGTRFTTNYLLQEYNRADEDIPANTGAAVEPVKAELTGWRFRVGVEIDLFRKNYQ